VFDVMIIDDETDVRERLASNIDWSGLSLQLAAQAADLDTARELYLLHQPKIIITDINMPMGSGLDLAQELLELDSSLQCIVITGYGELSYAQRALHIGAIEFLLKPVLPQTINESLTKAVTRLEKLREQEASLENMRQLWEENLDSVRDAYLGNLLRLGEKNADAVKKKLLDLQIDCPGPYYSVALLTLDQQPALEHYESVCLLMEKQTGAFLREAGFRYYLFFDSHFRLTCLVSSRAKNMDNLFEAALLKLKNHLQFINDSYSLCAGIGAAVSSPDLLKDSFAQAKAALSFQADKGSVIHYKNISACEHLSPIGRHTVHDLRLLFLQKKYSELETRLSEHLEALESQENSVSQIRAFSLKLLALLSGECSRQELPIDQIMSSVDLLRIFSSPTCQDIRDSTLAILRQMNYLQSHHASNNINHLISLAKDYMLEHLRDADLCLNTVSEAIGLSSSYFCDLFHRTEHISFSNYLKVLRINHAKTLLRTTNLKIFEIADTVGFCNARYFCYVFKKEVKKTPTEYQLSFKQ
jgi:two-component system response regulator YesN